MWIFRIMDKAVYLDRMTNKVVLARIGEESKLVSTIIETNKLNVMEIF